MHKTSNNWSKRDQDLLAVTLGVGGKNHIFEQINDFHTNEPKFFKERNKAKVDNFIGGFKKPNKGKTPYFYYNAEAHGQNAQLTSVDQDQLNSKNQIYACGKAMNLDGKAFYSKKLDQKYESRLNGPEQ